jgi:hypothetical protein
MLTYSFIAICSCSLVLHHPTHTFRWSSPRGWWSTGYPLNVNYWLCWWPPHAEKFKYYVVPLESQKWSTVFSKNLDDLAGTSCCSGFYRHYQFDIGARYTAGPRPPQQHNAGSDPFPPGPTGYRFGTYECSRYPPPQPHWWTGSAAKHGNKTTCKTRTIEVHILPMQ